MRRSRLGCAGLWLLLAGAGAALCDGADAPIPKPNSTRRTPPTFAQVQREVLKHALEGKYPQLPAPVVWRLREIFNYQPDAQGQTGWPVLTPRPTAEPKPSGGHE